MELLPLELLIKAFNHLEKKDITECSKVCKCWNRTIKQPSCISIALIFDRFQELLHDLEKYPSFGLKVESLKVQSPDKYDGAPELLRSILCHCPNLVSLDFTKIRIRRYLKILESTGVALPSLKNIIIRSKHNMVCRDSELEALLTSVDYKFRRTLTRLHIENASGNLYNVNYSGVMEFISKFPQLTSIWYRSCYHMVDFDLEQLFKINANIESLGIVTPSRIKYDYSQLQAYPSMKRLLLADFEADITFLSYILLKFPNLTELVLAKAEFTSNDSIIGEEAERIIDQILCLPVKKDLEIYYGGKSYLMKSSGQSFDEMLQDFKFK